MTTRAIFMGTPEFAVPSLIAAIENGWDVMVVTQPDRKVGRKRVLTASPVKVAAQERNLPVLQPERVRDADVVNQLSIFEADILITAAYGQLLPQSVLNLPRVGAVNVHASLLPRWRGAAPIHRAIMAGDKETGVTLMEMVSKLDAGPIIECESTAIAADDTVGTVHDRLAVLGAKLVHGPLQRYVSGEIEVHPQSDVGVTYAAKIERRDEFIDWHGSREEVYRHIRGLTPWPGATAQLETGEWVKLWSAQILDTSDSLPPGRIEKRAGDILVGTSDFAICLTEVQTAGKKRMAAKDWFSGLQLSGAAFKPSASEAVQ